MLDAAAFSSVCGPEDIPVQPSNELCIAMSDPEVKQADFSRDVKLKSPNFLLKVIWGETRKNMLPPRFRAVWKLLQRQVHAAGSFLQIDEENR